jgi:hypothetical protein
MAKEQNFFSRMLNGEWQAGTDRAHLDRTAVPGLAGDPGKVSSAPLWYSRHVTLPAGDWTHATLVLKGARFMPAVYVNGDRCSSQPGGMAPTVHPLRHPAVEPGQKIRLEIELQPLDKVPAEDASRIPDADLWRSNISSCLWDDVVLRCHGPARIARLLPAYDHTAATLVVRWRVDAEPDIKFPLIAEVVLRDEAGNAFLRQNADVPSASGVWTFVVPEHWPRWSPDDPTRLHIQVTLKSGKKILDRDAFRFGLRDFRTAGLGFTLNGEPYQIRAGTVAWHRWTRDPEARELAFESAWFRTNIAEQLLARGANTLRFHLGSPPENLLEMCDEAGLTVQAEWPFFHGIKASQTSMESQWRYWLDLALRHPSVVLIHPWNETNDSAEAGRALDAIRAIEPEFPPFVLSHRDVFHLHRYWWSLFEDLGLDYDSAAEFTKPVVADEFGGNYLDGEGNPGLYPALEGSFQRFLGRHHTLEDRLTLQRDATGRIAEYWRRLGVAGFSPFCILGSPEDGNHHFMGHLRDAIQKPVWDALTAAYSPISCSLELWDRNFLPGSSVKANIHLFNDTTTPCEAVCMVHIEDCRTSKAVGHDVIVRAQMLPRGRHVETVTIPLPNREGDFLVTAVLIDPADAADYPVVSFWEIRTTNPVPPPSLADAAVCVPGQEPHLLSFLNTHGIRSVFDAHEASVLLFGAEVWNRLPRDPRLASLIESAIDRGVGVAMIEAGPREDQHMRSHRNAGAPLLEQRHHVGNAPVIEAPLFRGLRVRFTEAIEGESCVHPSENTIPALWERLPAGATRIWNGRRGGMIVPACNMEISGLAKESFLACWRERGAPVDHIRSGGACTAFELDGHFAFAETPEPRTAEQLKDRVKFLADDAPALAPRLNPSAPVKETNLAAAYRDFQAEGVRDVRPLACAGRSLVRTPVVEVGFGDGKGRLLISQLYTEGRLVRGTEEPGLYGVRHDPAAEQFALNLIGLAAAPDVA